ncbi:YHS domain-containing protein [Sinimarinibacterium sp. CAU 1509]|nr:YHS domain-containing protein [Sinimarinibacterium sp. CAU 1509]
MASIVLAASAIAAPLSVQAADEHNVSLGYSAAGAPLAVHGYDPVSYFTDGKPMRGSDELTVVHDGAAYRFASAEHRDLFKANPARYAPQFGGYCAYGVSVGKKFDGDPMLWTIRDERLYLNLNPEIVAAFNKDVPGNIKKAEGKWQKIEHSAVKDL